VEKNDVEKLVLDVRMNGGGNNQLIKPIITGIIQLKKINKKGKFFCIIGRRTFSACQNLVNELERYTEVIFVGEPLHLKMLTFTVIQKPKPFPTAKYKYTAVGFGGKIRIPEILGNLQLHSLQQI